MKIKTLFKDSEQIKFVVEETNEAFLNTLRRAASFEVPTMAIEDVYFIKNSSALYDEIIAHRLGLIPLKTDLKLYSPKETCSCKGEGCPKCQIKFTLNVKGPMVVRAEHLKSSDPKIISVFPTMPIAVLLEGQEIELEAIAVLGEGKEHVKWSPCLSFYQRYPKITIKNTQKAVEGAKYCPKDVFEIKGKTIKIKNLEKCDLCRACQDNSNKDILVDGVPGKFIFTIESWGQLKPKEILLRACEILKAKTKELKI